MEVAEDKKQAFRNLQLYHRQANDVCVCNVKEDDAKTGNKYTHIVADMAKKLGATHVVISAKIESEIAQLSTPEEKAEFLKDLGLEETGLSKLIRAGYQLLDLVTYFTIGPKEARAWTIKRSTKATRCSRRYPY